jgi:ABC-type antimicrobial peptide transport system permease subunit
VGAQGDTAAVVGSVKQRLAEIDPAIPVLAVSSFAEHMNLLLYEDRRNAWIGFAIALLALALGAVGVHGVVSLVTARRTREIGLRVVLGADRRQVLWLLLGKGVRLALVGAILGIAGGLAAGRLLQNQLHGIEATDPWSIVVGTTVLITVALAASFAPAWRATRLDPAVALRDD